MTTVEGFAILFLFCFLVTYLFAAVGLKIWDWIDSRRRR